MTRVQPPLGLCIHYCICWATKIALLCTISFNSPTFPVPAAYYIGMWWPLYTHYCICCSTKIALLFLWALSASISLQSCLRCCGAWCFSWGLDCLPNLDLLWEPLSSFLSLQLGLVCSHSVSFCVIARYKLLIFNWTPWTWHITIHTLSFL